MNRKLRPWQRCGGKVVYTLEEARGTRAATRYPPPTASLTSLPRLLTRPSHVVAAMKADQIQYSEKYHDDKYEYRCVCGCAGVRGGAVAGLTPSGLPSRGVTLWRCWEVLRMKTSMSFILMLSSRQLTLSPRQLSCSRVSVLRV